MRFIKKQEPIEAEQFDTESEWPGGVFLHEGRTGIYTMNGFRHVNQDDWIITGPQGDKRVCDCKTFEEDYEEAL